MIKKIVDELKKYSAQISLGVFMAAAALSYALIPQATHAAADTDLVSAWATGTNAITDNKGTVLGWFAGIFVVTLIIVVAKRLFGAGKGQVAGSIGGGKRRR